MTEPAPAQTKQITVHGVCPVCGTEWWVDVDLDQYTAYKDGMLAQDAFPDMPSEARELLISGICDRCWKLIEDGYEEDC